MLASFLSIWYKLESFEERTSMKKMPPYNLSIIILIISCWGERTQPIVGGIILGLMLLSSKESKQSPYPDPQLWQKTPTLPEATTVPRTPG